MQIDVAARKQLEPEGTGERERKYAVAMAAGTQAFAQKDYNTAIKQADAALASKATDAAAAKLKTEALAHNGEIAEQDRKYRAAMEAGQKAYTEQDYDTAIKQADVALASKARDLKAAELKQDAQARKAEVAEREQTYQVAVEAGQKAYDSTDYDTAIAQAEAALAIRAGDLKAAELKKDAQARKVEITERDRKYEVALAAGQNAYNRKDYAAAIKRAEEALANRPMDMQAAKLKRDADAGQEAERAAQAERESKYAVAVSAAQLAYQQKAYAIAIQQAETALAQQPQDARALKLRSDAQAGLEEEEGSYRKELVAGQQAYAQKEYVTAIKKAEAALLHHPNDVVASKLLKDARQLEAAQEVDHSKAKELMSQTQESVDLGNARRLFDQGDYDAAAKLCQAYPGNDAFARLSMSNRVEQATFLNLTKLFNNGEYSFTVQLKRQSYGGKAPFVELFKQARDEWEFLASLEAQEQANNWQSVLGKLSDPASAGLTNKPPFRDMLVRVENQKEHARLNATFETMLVWFGLKSQADSYIQTPDGRNAKRIVGKTSEAQRANYLEMLDQLERGYQKGGWLDEREHAKYLKKLRDAITRHE